MNLFIQVIVDVVLITESEYLKDNYHIIAFSPKVPLPKFCGAGTGVATIYPNRYILMFISKQ